MYIHIYTHILLCYIIMMYIHIYIYTHTPVFYYYDGDVCTYRDVYNVMKKLPGRRWVKYEPGQPHKLAQDLDAIMGFS